MTSNPVSEAERAWNPPLFADVPGDIGVSFEFFPPKTPAMEATLWESFETLKPLAPRFVSVTYGAGGSTRERTHNTVARIAGSVVPAAAHLTCVDASCDDIAEVAEAYWEAGVRHIVALRGDPPKGPNGVARFEARPNGYANAAALVAGLKRHRDFEVSVGCYPEVHPEASCAAADMDALKAKIDAGASRGISQFFFEPETFLRFRDRAAAAGISAEMVPGILPVTNFANLKRMAGPCGTQVPDWMARLFEGLDDKPAARQLVAATVAAELCRRLYAGGVRHFHFYTLNRAELAYAICHMLGLRPQLTPTGLEAAA
ncbi:methylenetetrahydrofolate reductase [Polymorphobacter multimanifer]|uniref:Methylenetetrahydrofolate reductase n=1 Tax=Polymorphobacter multimanifer TaxID=1070431 RepID=A0A841L7X1_9SPHN|nr:methylenetetrahydrofolate reductase [NAD(P)H] [Polymorphobacter multimanifer]MBB6225955.1 methylenetetrahydrofolate reductase (NADPH) [Polymorphobacter multimanifer]GGI72722.1 methylenetetrahydrofolate reductase [Polymorphobacter multimanifer]